MKNSSYYRCLLPSIFLCQLRLQFRVEASLHDEHDPRKLIDFAVIGFNKCATSFLRWDVFGDSNPQSFFGDESKAELHPCSIGKKQIVNLYRDHVGLSTQDGKPIRNGFKDPKLMACKKSLIIMSQTFPNTNFIVATRHPVKWFESWYNFRLRQGTKMPPPEKTIGPCGEQCIPSKERCIRKAHGCTGDAKFHQYLSRLGFTPLNTKQEKSLLGNHKMSIHHFPKTKLFLMESSQLNADNRTRADIFIQDLERFVEMENSIPKLQPSKQKKHHIRKGVDPEEVERKSIKICDEKHKLLREHLLSIGEAASEWIEQYFLKSPQVFVSDKEYFLELIGRWKYDPCEEQVETDE